MKNILKGGFGLLLALAAGIAIAALLVTSRKPLEHVDVGLPSRPVEVIVAERIPFRSRITAYGIVEPSITLNSVAEVSGEISYLHPNLKAGETIPVGTLVLRIDAEDYEFTLRQAQEDLKASRSSLAELVAEEKSVERSVGLARQNLEVGEAEYRRLQDVFAKGLIARSALDVEEQKVIQLRQQIADLQGKLDGFDSRGQSIRAQIARAEGEVQNRSTILARTGVSLPFDARIGTVNVNRGEFVAVGAPLFEAIDLQGVEISAQLPLQSMRALVNHLEGRSDLARSFLQTGGDINASLGLSARVRLVGNLPDALWDGRVLRISEAIDPTRQTLGVVVGVERPYDQVIPGKRPPLLKGMYTAVELLAPPGNALVVPRNALHEGRVYVANSEDRLEIRTVELQMTQGDLALISSGIEPGERVIVTDLVPVIDGMPLAITRAMAAETALKQHAAGE